MISPTDPKVIGISDFDGGWQQNQWGGGLYLRDVIEIDFSGEKVGKAADGVAVFQPITEIGLDSWESPALSSTDLQWFR